MMAGHEEHDSSDGQPMTALKKHYEAISGFKLRRAKVLLILIPENTKLSEACHQKANHLHIVSHRTTSSLAGIQLE